MIITPRNFGKKYATGIFLCANESTMFITLHNHSVTYSTASVYIIDNVLLSEDAKVRMGIRGIG